LLTPERSLFTGQRFVAILCELNQFQFVPIIDRRSAPANHGRRQRKITEAADNISLAVFQLSLLNF